MRAASILVTGTGVSPQAVTVLQDVPSGISETIDNPLFICPNPAVNDVNIINVTAGAIITIFDFKGNAVLTKNCTSSIVKIDVSSLARGFYTIRLTDDRMVKTSKFIKQ